MRLAWEQSALYRRSRIQRRKMDTGNVKRFPDPILTICGQYMRDWNQRNLVRSPPFMVSPCVGGCELPGATSVRFEAVSEIINPSLGALQVARRQV